MLREPKFAVDIVPLVVDEAHCIHQRDSGFRNAWTELEHFRSYLPPGFPFLACSATMTPAVLAHVRRSLAISPTDSFHVNLGNIRTNITSIVVPTNGGASDLSSLQYLIKVAREGQKLTRALVFFKTPDLSIRATDYLRAHVPESLQEQIDYLHALRTKNGKTRVMKEFREGKINILCATECAGMVCTIIISLWLSC